MKLKETCGLHAEAYSAAEVRHGPIALAGPRFHALVFASRDQGRSTITEAEDVLRRAGATVLRCDPEPCFGDLPCTPAPHPLLDPICQVVGFYSCIVALARARGMDADNPRHISKVTVTV